MWRAPRAAAAAAAAARRKSWRPLPDLRVSRRLATCGVAAPRGDAGAARGAPQSCRRSRRGPPHGRGPPHAARGLFMEMLAKAKQALSTSAKRKGYGRIEDTELVRAIFHARARVRHRRHVTALTAAIFRARRRCKFAACAATPPPRRPRRRRRAGDAQHRRPTHRRAAALRRLGPRRGQRRRRSRFCAAALARARADIRVELPVPMLRT